MGISPAAATAITNFSPILDASGQFSTSSQVVGGGKIYASNYSVPTPAKMTAAIGDKDIAYADAAGRTTPDFTNHGAAGEIGGLTLVPGLYTWPGTTVLISTDVTLTGNADDVWIFQITGGLTQANGMRINLTGGALAKNVFWQTTGTVAIGTTAHFEGVVNTAVNISVNTTASVLGRLLAKTAVTLNQNAVTPPAP
jgi:hypothetical protein